MKWYSFRSSPALPWVTALLVMQTSCAPFKAPTLQGYENIRLLGLGKEGGLQFDLILQNPNQNGGRLRKAAGEAWLNETYLGPFSISEAVDIPPGKDFRIPVTLRSGVKNLLNSALTIFGSGDDPELRVEGKAWLSKGLVRFKYPIRYRERVRILR